MPVSLPIKSVKIKAIMVKLDVPVGKPQNLTRQVLRDASSACGCIQPQALELPFQVRAIFLGPPVPTMLGMSWVKNHFLLVLKFNLSCVSIVRDWSVKA